MMKRNHRYVDKKLHDNKLKYTVRKNIDKLWNACNTELFVKYLLCNTEIKTKRALLDYINGHKESHEESILDSSINVIFTGLDPIFEKITVRDLLDSCFDKLGVLNTKLISEQFILSQGIWLTNEEKVELQESNPDGTIRDRRDVIKERLGIDPKVHIKINPTGLTFAEFRSLFKLNPLPKISSLSTCTLTTLRDKVLLLLDNDLNYHIDKWTTLLKNVERVAEARNIALPVLNE